jgi:predicted transcriptional regulator
MPLAEVARAKVLNDAGLSYGRIARKTGRTREQVRDSVRHTYKRKKSR